jgi:hypothetical protein
VHDQDGETLKSAEAGGLPVARPESEIDQSEGTAHWQRR